MSEPFYTVNGEIVTVKKWAKWAASAIVDLSARLEAAERQRDLDIRTGRPAGCICDFNPETTEGPVEDCPQHGRTYAEWVEIAAQQYEVARDQAERADRAEDALEAAEARERRVRVLAEQALGIEETYELASDVLHALGVLNEDA